MFKEINFTALSMLLFGILLGIIISLQVHLHYELEKYNNRLDYIEQELDLMNEMLYNETKMDLHNSTRINTIVVS